MITIVELPEFIRRSKKWLTEDERNHVIYFLAAHPAAGVLLPGTGGIRKVRWKREGTGKSSGVRVIYYFYHEHYPLFLLTLFGKSEKVTLTQAECHKLAQLAHLLREK